MGPRWAWLKRLSLCAVVAVSLAAACSEDSDSGDGSKSGGSGGTSASGGSTPGGAAGEAGHGGTSGEATGGRSGTGAGGTSGSGGSGGSGGASDAGEGGETGGRGGSGGTGGVGCGNGTCEANEDCASCGSDCGACSCEYFLREGTYPRIKSLLKFQITWDLNGVDYSSEALKDTYPWIPDDTYPNDQDFHAELCAAWDWLAAADRFANLNQPTTVLSSNGNRGSDELNPEQPHYFVPLDEGWRIYIRWVAHNIALELRHELPWSLERLAQTNPDAALALLDSTEMMHRYEESDFELGHASWHYPGQPFSSHLGMTIIGMPRYTYRFLEQNGIVKATEHETVVALLEWARNNMAHFVGPLNRESCQQHWQHPYPPTVEMVIEGTTSTAPLPSTIPRFQHWTMGCTGTSQFIKDVLRAVNIPARLPTMCGHTQLWLPGLDLWMDHGDDPYTQTIKASMCSASYLLVDRATWQAAFGMSMTTVYSGGPCDAMPVGRRAYPESIAMCPLTHQ